VPMTQPGGTHGAIQIVLGSFLRQFVQAIGLGMVFGDTGYILARNPDTGLAPDLSVARKDRLPPDIEWFLEVAPDLAFEIVSPSNSAGSIEREIAIDPAAGVPAVWIVSKRAQRRRAHARQGATGLSRRRDPAR
jgi:Uma2 family endonuclease